jgi:multimeric flavodoxin WrbA
MVKAIGIVGSPRKGGNTEILTEHTLKAIAEEGLETELIRLADLDIRPCNACRVCRGKEPQPCPIDDDLLPVYEKMKAADAIILASPVYFGSATALMKALVERTGYMAYDERPFAGKVGGPLVVARRAGKNFTFVQLMFWFHIMGMVMPGSTYWNVAYGRGKGDVRDDEEGLATAWNFGKNIAFVVKKLKA